MEKRPASLGSIIGLKPEYREPYIVLHRNTFPRVLEQIHRSNICDYSIFLQDGLLSATCCTMVPITIRIYGYGR
jgi:L-rhamnose mutarotase